MNTIINYTETTVTKQNGREITIDNFLTLDRTPTKNGEYYRLVKIFTDAKKPFRIIRYGVSAEGRAVYVISCDKYRKLDSAKNVFKTLQKRMAI